MIRLILKLLGYRKYVVIYVENYPMTTEKGQEMIELYKTFYSADMIDLKHGSVPSTKVFYSAC